MRTALVYLIAIAAVAAALFFSFPNWFTADAKDANADNGGAKPKRAVVVARVTKAPFDDKLEALGTVQANESVTIVSNRADHVARIYFEDGQLVEKGDLLVEMHAKEEKAMLAEAIAVRDDRRLNHTRAKELFDQNLTSEREYEAARALLDASEARVSSIAAAIADRQVHAPFSGVLGLRRISVGAFLQPSTVITTLDDLSVVKLDFTIPETWLSSIRTGMKITARSDAWVDDRFSGEVATIATRLDPRTRSATVRAQLPNPGHRLRPGMLLKVLIDRGRGPVLQVPEEALILSADNDFVLRVRRVAGSDNDYIAERISVTTGRRRVGAVEIKAGLEPEDQVIIEGIVPVDEAIVEENASVPVRVVRIANPKS